MEIGASGGQPAAAFVVAFHPAGEQAKAGDVFTMLLAISGVVQGRDDIAALAETFNGMLDRLERAFAAQREFVDDAGHELRTPITIVRGHLELMGDDPGERDETVRIVMEELDRMSRIVEDLLLAKAERPDFVTPEPVQLAELTADVFVKARALGDRDWKLAEVADGGPGVQAQDAAVIFERFRRHRRRTRPRHRAGDRRRTRRVSRAAAHGRQRRHLRTRTPGIGIGIGIGIGAAINRILIVEDEERIASFVEKGLRANGFTTSVVGDGEYAASSRTPRPI